MGQNPLSIRGIFIFIILIVLAGIIYKVAPSITFLGASESLPNATEQSYVCTNITDVPHITPRFYDIRIQQKDFIINATVQLRKLVIK